MTYRVTFKTFAPESPIPKGVERILVIDNEQAIVKLISTCFTRLGYLVRPFANSLEALSAFQATPYAFDAVVTDLAMPHLSGYDLARQTLAIRPDILIILCTGFSEIISKEMARELGICDYIRKPINSSDLARALRKALDKI